MKILYVTTISNTVNAFLIPHIKMLIDNGHEVDVAFNIEQDVKEEIYTMGCNIYDVDFKRSPFKNNYRALVNQIKNIILNGNYNLVHTHTPIASAIVRLACKDLKNVRVIYTAHGFHFFEGAPEKNWAIFYPIEKLLSKFTDVLITMNEEDYQIASTKLKANKTVKVNGVGINLDKFETISNNDKRKLRAEYGLNDDDFILIYVAELSHRKNQVDLIKAVSNVVSIIPNIKLLLIGEGPLKKEYTELIHTLENEEYVKLLGYRTDISSLMNISDVLVSSSRQEGLPVNVMEGMASGLPAIVTNSRGNRDLIKNNINGFVVELNDIQGLSKEIIELFNNKKLRDSFGKNNLQQIHNYSIENVLEEMEEIYSEYL